MDPGRARPSRRVRQDLLGDSALLASLADLIEVGGSLGVDGTAPTVVVGAPHHCRAGGLLAAGHDVETGPIAQQVARDLGGRHVVADELRTFVDLNKGPPAKPPDQDPDRLGASSKWFADRALAEFYQSQIFCGLPRTVVEIHGFDGEADLDIELSTGLSAARHRVGGPAWAPALQAVRETLRAALQETPGPWGALPRVGVFPLDRAVRMRASDTWTFERVSRLRLLGLDIHGLHIELHKRLRVGRQVSAHTTAALARAIVKAVEAFRAAAPPPAGVQPERLAEALGMHAPGMPLSGTAEAFEVRKCLEASVGTGRVHLHADDLARLGLRPGETALVAAPGSACGRLLLPVAAEDSVPATVRLEASIRRRLGVRLGQQVLIASCRAGTTDLSGTPGVVLAVREDDDATVELLDRGRAPGRCLLRAAPGRSLEVDTRAGRPPIDLRVPSVTLGWRQAQHLGVTCGDVLWIEAPEG
jgi:hypothetical protein